MVRFRSLSSSDIQLIHALEVETYEPCLHVSEASFLRLIALYPAGAIGGFDEDGLCGYAFGLPLRAGTVLDLIEPLAAVPDDADVFYVHDVAVAARCRGRSVGRALAERLLAHARGQGFTRAELVSVQGSEPFWERFGFRTIRAFEYVPGVPSLQMMAEL